MMSGGGSGGSLSGGGGRGVEAKDHQDAFEVQVRAELGILGLGEY